MANLSDKIKNLTFIPSPQSPDTVGATQEIPESATVPDGWLEANGQVVAQADYPDLFALYGTTFDTGGEGAGNFRLPGGSYTNNLTNKGTLTSTGGNVGIGETSPLGTLHVATGDSTGSVAAEADDLIVENNGPAGMTILSSAGSSQTLYFAEPGDTSSGFIQNDTTANKMFFGGGGAGTTLTLDSNSNAGIGTTSPGAKLHVRESSSGASFDAGADGLVVESSAGTGITIATGTSSLGTLYFADSGGVSRGYIYYNHGAPDSMVFGTASSDALTIDSAGVVTVNGGPAQILATGGSNGTFEVKGNGNGNGLLLQSNTSNESICMADDTQTGGLRLIARQGSASMKFETGGIGSSFERLTISSSGVVNISNLTASSDVQTDGSKNLISVSDARLKQEVSKPLPGLAAINQLTPRYYRWKSDIEKDIDSVQLGFYSQEVNPIIPEAAPIAPIYDDSGEHIDDSWGFNTRAVVAVCVKAIQELSSKVTALEAQLNG